MSDFGKQLLAVGKKLEAAQFDANQIGSIHMGVEKEDHEAKMIAFHDVRVLQVKVMDILNDLHAAMKDVIA